MIFGRSGESAEKIVMKMCNMIEEIVIKMCNKGLAKEVEKI